MRSIGGTVPSVIISFAQGWFTTTIILAYTLLFDPLDITYFGHASGDYMKGLLWAIISSIISYLSQETMILGSKMAKSALSAFGR